jgi:protein-disulfide isomerase
LTACGDDLAERSARATEAVEAAGQPTSTVEVPEAESTARPDAPTGARAATGALGELSGLGYEYGSPDASVRIIEFSDFGCGYCRRFHLEAYPALKEKYVDSGKIVWQYVPYVLGIFPNGLEAALAGECAGEQGMIESYGDRLFQDQPEWKNADGSPDALFLKYAREEGLDVDRFQQCLDEDWRRERVRQGVIAGGQLGVRGTPTFFIPGYQPIQGSLPPDVFEQVLEYVLKDATPSPP